MVYSAFKSNYIIIDSQVDDIEQLSNIMNRYENYTCVGLAKNNEEGLNLILEELPHLVFLNVDMDHDQQKSNAFNLINELRSYLNHLPEFIVLSDTVQHSYQAIKNGVLDYLLKPFNPFDIKKALLRYKKKQPDLASICIKSFTEYRFLSVSDIIYLKADNNTTDFYLTDGSMLTAYQPIRRFEVSLPNIFVRVHKSYIVNIQFITKIHFSKLQCSLKFTSDLIPFSKTLKSKMHEIKDMLMSRNISGHFQQNLSF